MRNRAFSIYSVFGGSGFSLGLVLSGLLTEVNWRLTLLVPAPVALTVLAAAWLLIPRDPGGPGAAAIRPARRADGDRHHAAARVHGTSAQQAGWASARTLGSFALVVAGLAGFAVIEVRSRDPLVPFGIFRSGSLRRANVGAVTLFGSYVSFQFLATQYLQSLAGWSAIVHRACVPARPGRWWRCCRRAWAGCWDWFGPGQARRGRVRLPGPRLRGVPAGRRHPGLPGRDAADDAAGRAGVRAGVLRADRGRDRRAYRTRSRAWPPACSRPRSRWAAPWCWPWSPRWSTLAGPAGSRRRPRSSPPTGRPCS